MIFVIELLFLIAGIWIMVSASPPQGLFRILFGKGQYSMEPGIARLYGLFLASPLPISLFVAFVLGIVLGSESTTIVFAFELIYLLMVAIASIVVARRIRKTVPEEPAIAGPAPASSQETQGYARRLLVVSGLAVLSCITLVSLSTLVMTVGSSLFYGVRTTGDFSQDVLPLVILLVIIGVGIFGSYRLIRILRN
jgi:hypothetical protein